MIVSFSIDDLKHTVPGAADLASMTGDELAAPWYQWNDESQRDTPESHLTMIDKVDAIIVVFSKQQVRQIKLAHFLKTFGSEALPDGPKFAAGSGDEVREDLDVQTRCQ